jgi:hypothetical protein
LINVCLNFAYNLFYKLFSIFIILKVIGGTFTRDYCVQDTDTITATTKVMKILYFASILAGELDSPELALDEDNEPNSSEKSSQRASTIPQVRRKKNFIVCA